MTKKEAGAVVLHVAAQYMMGQANTRELDEAVHTWMPVREAKR